MDDSGDDDTHIARIEREQRRAVDDKPKRAPQRGRAKRGGDKHKKKTMRKTNKVHPAHSHSTKRMIFADFRHIYGRSRCKEFKILASEESEVIA